MRTARPTPLWLVAAAVLLALPAYPAERSGAAGKPAWPQPEPSVLERFRTYSGERTPEEFSALFAPSETSPLRQQPRIALSNGSTAVILAIKLPTADGTAPNFSLRNATLVNLQQKTASDWVVTALPAKGVAESSLVVVAGTMVREYPLVVAPPVDPETATDPASFREYLKPSEAVCRPDRDLNKDGRCDYRDDYIFTANYLHRESTAGRSKDARRQRALQRTLSNPAPPGPAAPVSGTVTDPNFTP